MWRMSRIYELCGLENVVHPISLGDPVKETDSPLLSEYDPYHLFKQLANEWYTSFLKEEKPMFGEIIDFPKLSSVVTDNLKNIFQKFEQDYTSIIRVAVSSDDIEKKPLLRNATAWSKNVGNGIDTPYGMVIFYNFSLIESAFMPQLDEHEALHLMADRVTQQLPILRLPLNVAGIGDINPIMYPSMGSLHRFEDWVREGTVLLLQETPMIATQAELLEIIRKFRIHSVLELHYAINSLKTDPSNKTTAVSSLANRAEKELFVHAAARFYTNLCPQVPLQEIPNCISSLDVTVQKRIIAEICLWDAKDLVVTNYLSRSQRFDVLRARLLHK